MQKRFLSNGIGLLMGVVVLSAVMWLSHPADVLAKSIFIDHNTTASELIEAGATEDSPLNICADLILILDTSVTVDHIFIYNDVTLKIVGAGGGILTVDSGDGVPINSSDGSGHLVIESGEVCFKSNAQPFLIKSVNIYDGIVNVLGSGCISASDHVTITGGKVYSLINASGDVTISGGTVVANSDKEDSGGIMCRGKFIIAGEHTTVDVNVKGTALKVGSMEYYYPMGLYGPEGGYVDRLNEDFLVLYEKNGSISKTAKFAGSYGGGEKKDAKKDDKKDKDEHSDDDSDITSKPAATNPLSLVLTRVTGLPYGTIAARATQGPAAKALFAASMPAGYVEGFSFNLITNGGMEPTLKSGSLTMGIPQELRKQGRTFAILALDKNGKILILPDTDNDPATITAALNVEGYAFDLIYKD